VRFADVVFQQFGVPQAAAGVDATVSMAALPVASTRATDERFHRRYRQLLLLQATAGVGPAVITATVPAASAKAMVATVKIRFMKCPPSS
jgi:hypothetical protein